MRILAFPGTIRRTDNPYGELLYRDMPNFGVKVDSFSPWRAVWGRYDVFHLHWPEYYLNLSLPKALLGSLLVLLSTAWLRMRGTRILWTVHNPHSHAFSHPSIEALFWRIFTRILNGFISLSEACTTWVGENVPCLRQVHSAEIPHGHYREAYPAPVRRARARRALGLTSGQTVLLFFGGVSPYKNVPHLITTFRDAALPDTMMLIAGRAESKKYAGQIEMAANADRRIKLDLRRIPEDEVGLLFSAADLVVLPFSDIMHSGSAILALSFNRPVLVPAQGSLPELQTQVGAEWVQTYQGELTPAILTAAAAWARNSNHPQRPDLSSLDWTHIVHATIELYSRLCTRSLASAKLSQPTANIESQAVGLNRLPRA